MSAVPVESQPWQRMFACVEMSLQNQGNLAARGANRNHCATQRFIAALHKGLYNGVRAEGMAQMSEVWTTKYGPRRVRRDPPVLAEAIAAAQGLTDDIAQQAELAASLMGISVAEVKAEMEKAASRRKPLTVTAVDRRGVTRAVVVERRPSRLPMAGRSFRP
jgi:hypothetical protein